MSSILRVEPGLASTHRWAHFFIQGRSGKTARDRFTGLAEFPPGPGVLPAGADSGLLHAASTAPPSGSSTAEATTERLVNAWLGTARPPRCESARGAASAAGGAGRSVDAVGARRA